MWSFLQKFNTQMSVVLLCSFAPGSNFIHLLLCSACRLVVNPFRSTGNIGDKKLGPLQSRIRFCRPCRIHLFPHCADPPLQCEMDNGRFWIPTQRITTEVCFFNKEKNRILELRPAEPPIRTAGW